MTKFLGKTTAVIFSLLLLAACNTTKTDEGSTNTGTETTAPEVDVKTAEQLAAEAEANRLRLAEEADMTMRQARTIYFAYDKSYVSDEYRDLIQAHAMYLAKNPGTSVKLEGHADERGTPEYNIALGEARAKALSEIFSTFGVSSSQMEVISYGEERAVNMGHNEAAWAKNRRVEIVY